MTARTIYNMILHEIDRQERLLEQITKDIDQVIANRTHFNQYLPPERIKWLQQQQDNIQISITHLRSILVNCDEVAGC